MPVSFKVGTAFLIIALVLLSIIFMLFIPNIQHQQYQKTLAQTDQIVRLTRHQILLVVDYFREYRTFEKDKSKKEIENALEKMNMNATLNTVYSFDTLENELKTLQTRFNCAVTLMDAKGKIVSLPHINVAKSFDFEPLSWETWKTINDTKSICQNTTYALYKTKIKAYEVNLSCNSEFEADYKDIEKDVKKIVQDGFSLSESLHKGKVYLMWVNTRLSEEERYLRFDQLENGNNQNYCISKISNVQTPQTGALRVKDILDTNDTVSLRHTLDNQPAVTWISTIYTNHQEAFVLLLSAYENDIKEKIETPIVNLIIISMIALLISIFLGFLLFRKWIQKIETLSYTARKICLGHFNLRSHIRGKDDIGILGEAFDSMLDSIEDNINNLDQKVKERTLALEESLHTKETLLKEIHHRVKNNLALTMNFIKLQRFKIDNPHIQTVLGDIENRIYTMALLHTKLYESKNLDAIAMQTYVEELVRDIAQSYRLSEKITLQVNVAPLLLSIDYALPCGLIINECITNAIKHAFNEDGGTIHVSLTHNANHFILRIADNGKGFCENVNPFFKTRTLGLQLIRTIATKQLLGNIEYSSSEGLTWLITFEYQPK